MLIKKMQPNKTNKFARWSWQICLYALYRLPIHRLLLVIFRSNRHARSWHYQGIKLKDLFCTFEAKSLAVHRAVIVSLCQCLPNLKTHAKYFLQYYFKFAFIMCEFVRILILCSVRLLHNYVASERTVLQSCASIPYLVLVVFSFWFSGSFWS